MGFYLFYFVYLSAMAPKKKHEIVPTIGQAWLGPRFVFEKRRRMLIGILQDEVARSLWCSTSRKILEDERACKSGLVLGQLVAGWSLQAKRKPVAIPS